MDAITATLDAVARLARDADREALASLHAKTDAIEAAHRAIVSLGTVSDVAAAQAEASLAIARRRLSERLEALTAVAAAAIARMPADRVSRDLLMPCPTPRDLVLVLEGGSDEIDWHSREMGDPVALVVDGVDRGKVEPHSVHVRDGALVADGHGAWPLARIVAATGSGGLAFLLDDGTSVEMLADTSWRSAEAA